MLGEWGFIFVQIKGLVPFGAQCYKGQNKEHLDKSSKLFFS